MKRILMLTTGGTIASEAGENGLAPKTTGGQMLQIIPELAEFCEIDCIDLINLDSTNIQPEEWAQMAQAAFNGMQDHDGIVITHGTDTMAYSAAALSTMLINPSVPVVLTGSVFPITAEKTDAKKNILDAFVTAAEAPAGVYLVFDGRVIDGQCATKARSAGLDAFVSVNKPYAGRVENGKLILNNVALHESHGEAALDNRFDPKVLLFKLIPGFDSELLRMAAKLGYRGVILETFGPGGLTYYRRNLLPAVSELVASGVVVAVTTQCWRDGCDMNTYEVGIKALQAGIVPGGDFTTETLVARMMAALGRWDDPKNVAEFVRGKHESVDRYIPLT